MTGLCAIPSCDRAATKREWCKRHYQRWWRTGSPVEIPTKHGKVKAYFHEVVMPYDGDECLLWPHSKINGYGVMRVDRHLQLVSRLVCEAVNGPPPTPEHQAAHSCGKGHEGCCTKRHLSWKTRVENKADEVDPRYAQARRSACQCETVE